MIIDEEGHYVLERVYSDPSAAQERAMKFLNAGSYRTTIEPDEGRHVVKAWFKTREEAMKALD